MKASVKMQALPWLVALMLLASCSSQKTMQQRNDCEKAASMADYDNCMRRANVGQDDAQRAQYR
jgi:hypothetical protein